MDINLIVFNGKSAFSKNVAPRLRSEYLNLISLNQKIKWVVDNKKTLKVVCPESFSSIKQFIPSLINDEDIPSDDCLKELLNISKTCVRRAAPDCTSVFKKILSFNDFEEYYAVPFVDLYEMVFYPEINLMEIIREPSNLRLLKAIKNNLNDLISQAKFTENRLDMALSLFQDLEALIETWTEIVRD